jgi:hypothetical protein
LRTHVLCLFDRQQHGPSESSTAHQSSCGISSVCQTISTREYRDANPRTSISGRLRPT